MMKAELVYHEKKYIAENAFREIKLWKDFMNDIKQFEGESHHEGEKHKNSD